MQKKFLLIGTVILSGCAKFATTQPARSPEVRPMAVASGPCSVALSNVTIEGNASFTLNCPKDKSQPSIEAQRAIENFLAAIQKQSQINSYSPVQLEAAVKGMNYIVPGWTDQIDRYSVSGGTLKPALENIAKISLKKQATPDEILDSFIKFRGKLLPGVTLSECGCWPVRGSTGSSKNPYCLSEKEENVSCIAKSGPQICEHKFPPLIGIEVEAYSPWQRICS